MKININITVSDRSQKLLVAALVILVLVAFGQSQTVIAILEKWFKSKS